MDDTERIELQRLELADAYARFKRSKQPQAESIEPLWDGIASMIGFDGPIDFDAYASLIGATLAHMMADSAYCEGIIVLWHEDLIQLTPWMPQIGGMFPPESMSWHEWIDCRLRCPV